MKTMFIMRGLPGSGKSHKAAIYAKRCGAVICSADDYFMQSGQYAFDAAKIQDAHKACFAKAEQTAKEGKHIVIDNTNTQRWEFAPYLALAEKYGMRVHVKISCTAWAWDVDECARRNTHGVPADIIQRMKDRFEH